MNNSSSSSQKLAKEIRAHSLRMVTSAMSSHIGGSLSMADLIAVLYQDILKFNPENPDWNNRDRFLLSKGHSCAALYAALALKNFFPLADLSSYGQNGSNLMAHISHRVPGVEFSTGSLGHALPFACGKALFGKRNQAIWKTFVLLSDGELNEGSNWESFLFAPQHQLDNLVVIVDYNKIQSLGRISDVIELAPLNEKFKAFHWAVREINGHDHEAIYEALSTLPWELGKPSVLIANTIKGKGVDFMEDTLKWHYSSPDADQLENALFQLGCNL